MRTSAIVHRSVFVHGYLHGYEEGFHLADLDLQMGRSMGDVGKRKEAREGFDYRPEFGDKHFFELGYREGLRIGYNDGIAGRNFRAYDQLQEFGDLDPGPDPRPDPAFDEGFSQGYESGQRQGLQDGHSRELSSVPTAACPASPPDGSDEQSFCAAYVSGFHVGYSDAVVNATRPAIQQAEAQGGAN